MLRRYRYDVALSFAGEQREFIHKVFKKLKSSGLTVFYDEDPDVQAKHIGERFSEISQAVYGSGADNVIIFISKDYVVKQWPVLESTHIADRLRKSLFRADSGVYLADFDRTPLPGLAEEIWRLKIGSMNPLQFCDRYLKWRLEHKKLNYDDIILMFAKSAFIEIINILSNLDIESSNHNDKVFILYNMACAKSRLARNSTFERERLLDEAILSLDLCFQKVEQARPDHLQDLLDFTNKDDDLIYLRVQRTNAMSTILRKSQINLNQSGVDYSKQKACVDPESMISTPNGAVKISELRIGDEVFCFSPIHGDNIIGRITDHKTFPLKERLSINDELIVSKEQLLFNQDKKWIESNYLKIGDAIMTSKGFFTEVKSIVNLDKGDVMIISIDESPHTFIANGFVCHNINKP